MIPPTGATIISAWYCIFRRRDAREPRARIFPERDRDKGGGQGVFDIQMDDLCEANPDVLLLRRERERERGGLVEKERSDRADGTVRREDGPFDSESNIATVISQRKKCTVIRIY